MASKTASKGNKAMRSDNSPKPDFERSVAMTTSDNFVCLDSSVAHSPLFKLSAELRNTIYRLVLVRDHDGWYIEPVDVDTIVGVPEPGLLLSNKIVRSEASGIFYYENHWNCEIRNYDPAPVLLLLSKLKMPFSKHSMCITIMIVRREVNRKTWRNLVSWLHMYRERKLPSLFYGVDCHDQFRRDERAEMALLDGLFQMVQRCPEMPSDMLDRVLDSMYLAWESCACFIR